MVGAGFIGLEFAATARAKGLEVDVIELAPRVMARAVTAEISEYFQSRHTAAGIRIHLGVQVTSIESDGGKVTGVSLSDGRHIKADLIVVGVGVLPMSSWRRRRACRSQPGSWSTSIADRRS